MRYCLPAFLVGAVMTMVPLLQSETQVPRLTFEVATVKPTISESGGGTIAPRGDRFMATNVPLRALIHFAYAPSTGPFLDAQIIGGPDWTKTDRFEIQAKMDGTSIPRSQIQLMLQSLLEERFQLKIHRETRELPAYDLVIITGGLKMKNWSNWRSTARWGPFCPMAEA